MLYNPQKAVKTENFGFSNEKDNLVEFVGFQKGHTYLSDSTVFFLLLWIWEFGNKTKSWIFKLTQSAPSKSGGKERNYKKMRLNKIGREEQNKKCKNIFKNHVETT